MSRLHCPHCRASVLNNPNENGFLLCPECGQRFRPREDYDDFDDEDFWLEVLGDGGDERIINDTDFFRGFGEGAAALWEKVKDKL